MSGLNRRELLAGLGGVSTLSLSGCVVCANSYLVYDDYLRVGINDFHQTDAGWAGTAYVHHRGPEDWADQKYKREDFNTYYKDVEFHAYNADGTHVLSLPLGDIDPGTTLEKPFETTAFPMTIAAVPGDVTFTVNCVHADTGSHIATYAGYYPTDTPPEWSYDDWGQPIRKRVGEHISRRGAGHHWVRYDEFDYPHDEALTEQQFAYAKCTQRTLEGRNPEGPPDFTALPGREDWLSWDETYSFKLYGDSSYAPTRGGAPARYVPAQIVELIRNTRWRDIDGPAVVEKSVSREEWLDIAGSLAGTESGYPRCGRGSTLCENWTYSGRGKCLGGHIIGHYRFDPHEFTKRSTKPNGRTLYWADSSVVRMSYRWNGVL